VDIPPDQLLLDQNEPFTRPEIWRKRKSPHFVAMSKLSKKEKVKIGQYVKKLVKEQQEPPPFIVDVCRKLGITHNVLKYHFPDEYTLISKRAEEWRNYIRTQAGKERIDTITRGVMELSSLGIYPSDRKMIEYRYVRPSDLRRPEAIEVLRALQKQFSGMPLKIGKRNGTLGKEVIVIRGFHKDK
jgi:hypothetical protein